MGRAGRSGPWIAPCAGMWIILGILLLMGWLGLKLVWNVASFGVHLLLIAAVIAVVVHFLRSRVGGRTRT